MMTRIGASVTGGNWKYAHGTAHYGRNFSVKWLKVICVHFFRTRFFLVEFIRFSDFVQALVTSTLKTEDSLPAVETVKR